MTIVVDTAREWPELPAVAALDAALLRGLVTPQLLQGTLERHRFVPPIPRAVRPVDDDLGRGWAPVEARIRRDLAVPGPVDRSFRAVPRERGRLRAAGPPG
jgi:hypothetical protein